MIGENIVPILETGQLGDSTFTTSVPAHTHLQGPKQSTPVGQQRHLVDNGAVTLSPVQLGQPHSSRMEVSLPAQFMDYKPLHSLTSRGKQNNFSRISACQVQSYFSLLAGPFIKFSFILFFSFFFLSLHFFSLNTEREKIHFHFQFLLKIFLFNFLLYFFTFV